MSRRSKATGWKIPIIFCLVIIFLIGLAKLFLGRDPAELPVPPALLEKARSAHLNLDDEGGKEWKERIIQAASGFSDMGEKDRKLAAIALDALKKDRQDAAAAATVLIKDRAEKDMVLERIFSQAVNDCDKLPYAVFAVRGTVNRDSALSMLGILEKSWKKCENSQP